MPVPHVLLTLLVVFIWGLNFLFVKICLEEISPLLLCALRFFLASVPAIFFIKPPKMPFRTVALYGLIMFALQFALLFLGIYAGMTAGMAALIMQVQIFFSMFFAAIFLDEQPTFLQVAGAFTSFIGIGVVAWHFDNHLSLLGFILILAAAATWGFGNLITKKSPSVNAIALIVWGSFIAFPPLFLCSLLYEGFASAVLSYQHISLKGIGALLYIVYASTWIGYGAWNWLLARYPIGMIVPFTLLIPIIGVLGSVAFLGEPLQTWKIIAGLFVVTGLCINLLNSYAPIKFNKKAVNA
ncbi:EamA family transporter [Legionella septentrionalis]|uniref:O-acetylserine/cysteine exporter n=1 Tax=Legionella septentrionalis TaxID=2498109 RepID=A0A3S0VAN5_9GAMM|nr:EamA family transporter [Legionella septentrionalis]RUQ88197.1 O-acetylserine/cysteine exporter [Legionella septentrionalis]